MENETKVIVTIALIIFGSIIGFYIGNKYKTIKVETVHVVDDLIINIDGIYKLYLEGDYDNYNLIMCAIRHCLDNYGDEHYFCDYYLNYDIITDTKDWKNIECKIKKSDKK